MNDQDWLAAQFVLGELSNDDVQKCESLLCDDQSFREAVARAVELLDATARGLDEIPAVSAAAASRGLIPLISGVLLGIAASVLVGFGLVAFEPFSPDKTPASPAMALLRGVDGEDLAIARLWVNRDQGTENSLDLSDDTFLALVDDTTDSADPPGCIPDWLVVAAGLDVEEGDDWEPSKDQDQDGG